MSHSLTDFNNTVNDILNSRNKTIIQKAYPKICLYAQNIADIINPLTRDNIDEFCPRSSQDL